MKEVRFDKLTAIVTGAGTGLGRSHALGLAARGAKVVVNDRGTSKDGLSESAEPALKVVEEIRRNGGTAIFSHVDVCQIDQVQEMVGQALSEFGSVDLLVNNAGILRDKSFAKIELEHFHSVMDVHLMGSVNCTKAVWPHMVEDGYGRIVMTTSASGLYGNYGQSNYSAAKAALIGLMNVLAIEGEKNNIRVNALAPMAATRMTEGLLSPEILELLDPESITPGVLALLSNDAPTKMILGAGAGCFAETKIYETLGIALTGDSLSPEGVLSSMAQIRDSDGQHHIASAFDQTAKFVRLAAAARGIPTPEGN